MELFIQIGQFLLSLSLLIVLHELGHFIPAKAFKTRVEKFYLFFDVKFSLFKKKIGETVYGIGWLPLGGYVKIAGMIDESMDTEAMKEEPKPWEFRSKPTWQRLIIMLGGVFVNFILALVIYILASFVYGDTDIAVSSIKDGYLVENKLLTDVGFKTGDKIIKVGNVTIENNNDIAPTMIISDNVTIERDGEQKVLDLPVDFLGQLTDSKDRNLFTPRMPFMIFKIPDSSQNKNAGFKPQDIVTSVNGEKLRYSDQVVAKFKILKGQEVNIDILRGKETLSKVAKIDSEGRLGVNSGTFPSRFAELGYYDIVKKEYGFGESFGVGVTKFNTQIGRYFGQLKKIFTPSTGAYKGVGGFYAILNVFPDYWSWQNFWRITAFLSIMLGVLNLLPIPALDGGHVMFLLYEMISGRKPGDKFMEYAQVAGFFILIALVLFANGNDIFKAIFK